jgi:hypothetical protein
VLIHWNNFVGVYYGEIKAMYIVFGKLCLDGILISDKVDANTIFARGLYSAQNSLTWSAVASHGIQGDMDNVTHL